MALSGAEQKHLCDHMAHNFKVHDMFYRQQEAAISLAKVSRVLVAVEAGKAADWSDKSARDVNIQGNYIYFTKFLVRRF